MSKHDGRDGLLKVNAMRHDETIRNSTTRRSRWARVAASALCAAVMVGATATPALATKVADVTHLKGRRNNTLMGYGLVVGLAGTGDGGKYAASILQLQAMLQKYEIQIPAAALTETKNVAIVMVEATLPENGVREGDEIDVRVSSTGSAKSLAGGRLVMTPLQGPGRGQIYAWASGQVVMTDPKIKTGGMIVDGARMESDIIHNYIGDDWTITLVIEDVHASYALASVISQMINEGVSEIGQIRRLSQAMGPKNVVVTIPLEERMAPADFIARIESTELLMPAGEARIVINRRTSTIAIGDGVEIGPAVIAHNGMSITTSSPEPEGTPDAPVTDETFAVGIAAPAAAQGGTKLRELVSALNQLKVPADDIIEIVENLHKLGKINGKLVIVE